MRNKKIQHKIKIFLAIFLSLIVVNMVTPQVFIADTPEISPYAFSNMVGMPGQFMARLGFGNDNPELGNPTNEDIPDNAVIRAVAPGVVAAETENKTFLRVEKGKKLNIQKRTAADGTEYNVVSP